MVAVGCPGHGPGYRWAFSAVAAIGGGAFAVSFLGLRDLMGDIGYSSATAWIFPAIIDTAVAVSTLMLVALGDKPARRSRTVTIPASAQTPAAQGRTLRPAQTAKAEVTPVAPTSVRSQMARHSQLRVATRPAFRHRLAGSACRGGELPYVGPTCLMGHR